MNARFVLLGLHSAALRPDHSDHHAPRGAFSFDGLAASAKALMPAPTERARHGKRRTDSTSPWSVLLKNFLRLRKHHYCDWNMDLWAM